MRCARKAVFSTAELLESILHELPTKDLLLAQAVSKHWKATIDNSPKLQRALFFKPVDLELLAVKWDCKHDLMSFGSCLIWVTGINGKLRWTTKDHRVLPVYRNPLLRDAIEWLRNPLSKHEPNWLLRGGDGVSSLPADGSWRRMLLTQPATEASWGPYRMYCESSCGVVKINTKKHRLADVLQKQRELCKDCYAGLTGAEIWQELLCNEQIEVLEPPRKSSTLASDLCDEGAEERLGSKRTVSVNGNVNKQAPVKAGLLSYSFI